MKTLAQAIEDLRMRESLHFLRDCERIQLISEINGISITLQEAEQLWKWNSSRQHAQWLSTHNDEDVEEAIRDYIAHQAGKTP